MRVSIITTGGTISKTYDEHLGTLQNERPVVENMVAALRLPDLTVQYHHVMNKDSRDLTDADRKVIVDAIQRLAASADAIVVLHGTDTMTVTGDLVHEQVRPSRVPIIFTGAMRPYEFKDSDAEQNVTEALLACRMLPPGVYVVMHNRVLKFPGVAKDHETLTFVQAHA